ncbi:C2H2-type zinc finger protein [Endozoicomonas sp. 4G]|uniref:C2H2-type zinc finger protein n=1 Tax=Endozoicomonas sp. 4G TaxID=2872754 RepID=UPI0020790E60|nr:C2H2-type zinc finger protein [Endozoicomonas sp. 4G]
MLYKKLLILTLVFAFSVHCSDGNAHENRLSLLFALRLLSEDNLKIGLYSPGVGTILLPLFPVRDGQPELDSMVKAIATEIQQRNDQQREIIATARQRGSLMLSCFRDSKRAEEPAEEGIEEESETIEWWQLQQEPEVEHRDMLRVCFADDILLKPGTRYCFSPDSGIEAKAYRRAASGDSAYSEDSGSEDSGNSDESSDNPSNEDETDSETGVLFINTTPDPFQALNEISDYCATLRQKMIDQNSISDGEITTEPKPHLVADQKPRTHRCDHEGCNFSAVWLSRLKKHKQTHLAADQKLRTHRCDHEGCNFGAGWVSHLKRHKQTHLPVDQRFKPHQCGHEGCNFSTDHTGNLKLHKQTHLPADQRLRMHQCDHEGCDYSTDHRGHLERHKQTHLSADQKSKRLKMHQCDHGGCDYSTVSMSHLKRHKQIHLPADQRLWVSQCDHEGCNFRTNYASNLKTHKQTHLPAGQRLKRKAYGQPPSDKKRKKGDKE